MGQHMTESQQLNTTVLNQPVARNRYFPGTITKFCQRAAGLTAIVLCVALLAASIGCVGYVGDGGGGVAVVGPDVFWGGPYERGVVVHDYAHRGAVSRGFAHGHR